MLRAHLPQDPQGAERRTIERLARSRRGRAAQVERARIVLLSWDGLPVSQIAERLHCHPTTVRRWLHRYNEAGPAGLADRAGSGRRPRITDAERRRIVDLARDDGAGRPTLDRITAAARAEGIDIGRSQVRRIVLSAR